MKFDTIIIGGGLAGLLAGIKLLENGKKVAIVSAGQSALHFCSGSFELLGRLGGKFVERPFEAIDSLPAAHPLKKMGRKRAEEYTRQFIDLMKRAGIELQGDPERNSWRLSPVGLIKPSWLTLPDHLTFTNPHTLPFGSAAIINVYGYIDFYPQFIAAGLSKRGVKSVISTYDTPGIAHLRKSSTEMRSSTIARVLNDEDLEEIADQLNEKSRDCEVILTPAVFGLYSEEPLRQLRDLCDRPLWMVPTIPANVPGVRTQLMLRERFQRLGGEYLLGDTALRGDFRNGRLKRIYTYNLGEMPLEADTFVMASGSFFSNGIRANMEKIYEPVLGLDVSLHGGRTQWYDKDFYAPQPYEKCGVTTDEALHPSLLGKPVENIYAVGSLLAEADSLSEMSGAGVTMVTSLHAASEILGNN